MASIMTSALAENDAPPLAEWAVATRLLPGEVVSGDWYVVQPVQERVVVAAIDGLGHGLEAAKAARIAAGVVKHHPEESIVALLTLCHQQLRTTRGVVMSVGVLDSSRRTLTWAGVGNVEGILLRRDPRGRSACENLLLHAGVVGHQLPRVSPSVLPVIRGDMLILATDGIRSGFVEGLSPAGSLQQIADNILTRYGRSRDDALVLVVRHRAQEVI